MFTEQIWRSKCIDSTMRRFGIEIPKEVADAIACLDRDELHRLIELLNLAVWLELYEEKWEEFPASSAWIAANKFLEIQTDQRIWLALLKVLVGLLQYYGDQMYENLLKEGETVERLNLGGWIVLSNLLAIGDEVIIDYDSYYPQLFVEPVRATITNISSNNLLKIDLQTEGAKSERGSLWPTGEHPYWLDCKFQCKKIVKQVN
jgi:hypothetical protein